VYTANAEPTTKNVVFQEVFDKEHILTLKTAYDLSVQSKRDVWKLNFTACQTTIRIRIYGDEQTEQLLDQLYHQDEYDTNNGDDQQDNTEAGRYIEDELAFEEDWIPDSHWEH
jgi:hypothetical protein